MHAELVPLGERLRKARKERNMTLQTLAEKAGLSAGLISNIENYRTTPSLPVLIGIANALKIDLAELFKGM